MAKLDTPEEWWAEVDAWWPNCRRIVNALVSARTGDSRDWWIEPGFLGDVTTADADRAMVPREGETTAEAMFERMRTERVPQVLYRALHKVWEDAPDDPVIHTWPGWGRLCDLLSEYRRVFDEDGEPLPPREAPIAGDV